MSPNPASAPTGRLIVKRAGKAITSTVPKPVVLIDTREQAPFDLARFGNWIGGVRRTTILTGDYSVEGMSHLICLERKSLPDLVKTLLHDRERFIRQLERMVAFKYRAILIEASYQDIKTPYHGTEFSSAHPNGVSGSLDAIEARFGISIIYTSTYRPLAEEKCASYLSKVFTYEWLEMNGHGRILQDGDL